ncbi:MAG: recombination mediator RecR, partial [Puniceicoccales bacterium]|nr:recombination mediator RecR [Puniceicoccales bacterium]
MSPAFEHVRHLLKQLPGLGHRSAERIALHLLVERPERLTPLVDALQNAAALLRRCPACGNMCEGALCALCADPARDAGRVCIVEQVPDLLALERAGAHDGRYLVLHGKLSPIQGIGPAQLNFAPLAERLSAGEIREIVLALSNDIEGEATCHYILDVYVAAHPEIMVSRIGFGIPSGSGLTY